MDALPQCGIGTAKARIGAQKRTIRLRQCSETGIAGPREIKPGHDEREDVFAG